MQINNTRKSRIGLYILAGLIILIFFLPIKIPYSIKVPGKVLPVREWTISKGTDGRLITTLTDNETGINSNYTVSQFERGDAINFSMNPQLFSGSTVSINDTVGFIYSNEIERQFIQLKGELTVAKASLAVYYSGEKKQVIEEETGNLVYMKKQAEEQRKIFERQKALFEKNLISQEEYEIAKGTTELYDINISIADAHLKSVQSGVKDEEIEYIKSQIDALQQQLDVLQRRFNAYTLVSRISGIARRITSGDTLLVVSDTSEYIIVMPVKWEERKFITKGQNVHLKVPSVNNTAVSSLLRLDKSVYNLNGAQVSFATAITDKNIDELAPGLMVESKIECNPVSPLEFLKRMF